ncbi:unnamed protein product [Gemmata massiliana]|uniref:Uncharacterized protein n=1 Tax=Gemmata massiliana TaxID=1210884 RepID=A0A6P2CTB1_9BACT|nr:hypothetical protein [Gemmata massiliana]VTR92133.1 unnamed protein product [Gemmata massiliana]
MAKGKKKADSEETTGVEEATATGTAAAPTAKPMTKTDAVRATLAAGIDTPAEGVAHIKKKFGIEMTPAAFSTAKFKAKSTGGGVATKAKATASGSGNHGRAATAASVNGHKSVGGSPAEFAAAVKALVAAHGVDAVKSMVDVFKQ